MLIIVDMFAMFLLFDNGTGLSLLQKFKYVLLTMFLPFFGALFVIYTFEVRPNSQYDSTGRYIGSSSDGIDSCDVGGDCGGD